METLVAMESLYWNGQGPNVSTTPITAMGCRQCLPLSVVQLKGKDCRKPHCRINGVVDTFGLIGFLLAFWHTLVQLRRPCQERQFYTVRFQTRKNVQVFKKVSRLEQKCYSGTCQSWEEPAKDYKSNRMNLPELRRDCQSWGEPAKDNKSNRINLPELRRDCQS